MCVSILPTCMSVHHLYAWYLCMPKEVVGSPRPGWSSDGSELPYVFWGPYPSPLEEQPMPLTMEHLTNPLKKKITHQVHFVLLIYLWLWDHPQKCGWPARCHTFKERSHQLFIAPFRDGGSQALSPALGSPHFIIKSYSGKDT